MEIDWKPFLEIVAENQSFVLTSHTRPDCDAIGSQIGLALALESMGKQVRIVNGDAVPGHIAFIDPDRRVEVIGQDISASEVHAADVHAVLDTSAWGQLGPMAEVLRDSPAKKVLIDHHVGGDDLGATVLKETQAEATGRLILEAIEALGAPLTSSIAKPLFYALATDTGWFRFSSVTEKTYLAAARLIIAGASPSEAFGALYDRNRLARVQLHGLIMTRIELALEGRVAYSSATDADFEATRAEVADTEDVVNRLLSIEGVEVAVLLVEMGGGKVKASLRSRNDFDVRQIAEQFGGGGHTKAAGVRFGCDLATAQTTLLDVLAAQMG